MMLAFYPPFILSGNDPTDFAAIGEGLGSVVRGVLRGPGQDYELKIDHANMFTVAGKIPGSLPTGTYAPAFFAQDGTEQRTSGVKFAVVNIPG